MKASCALLFLLVALPTALGYCPHGYALISNLCLKARLNDLPSTGSPSLSWDEARAKCRAEGADLAVIDTVELLSLLTSHIKNNVQEVYFSSIWVGARKLHGSWKWVNGKTIYENSPLWGPHQPGNDPQDIHAKLIPSGYNDELRLTAASKYGAVGFVCQK